MIPISPELWGFAPDPSKGGLMAPPSALPRLRGQTDSRFALVSALARGQPQNTYHSTAQPPLLKPFTSFSLLHHLYQLLWCHRCHGW
jgi:hypothetical protein